eukprot:2668966-Pleurochrysis_carterae.AAC.3
MSPSTCDLGARGTIFAARQIVRRRGQAESVGAKRGEQTQLSSAVAWIAARWREANVAADEAVRRVRARLP